MRAQSPLGERFPEPNTSAQAPEYARKRTLNPLPPSIVFARNMCRAAHLLRALPEPPSGEKRGEGEGGWHRATGGRQRHRHPSSITPNRISPHEIPPAASTGRQTQADKQADRRIGDGGTTAVCGVHRQVCGLRPAACTDRRRGGDSLGRVGGCACVRTPASRRAGAFISPLPLTPHTRRSQPPPRPAASPGQPPRFTPHPPPPPPLTAPAEPAQRGKPPGGGEDPASRPRHFPSRENADLSPACTRRRHSSRSSPPRPRPIPPPEPCAPISQPPRFMPPPRPRPPAITST